MKAALALNGLIFEILAAIYTTTIIINVTKNMEHKKTSPKVPL